MQSLKSNRGGGQGLLAGIAIICIAVAAYLIFKQTKADKDSAFGDTYYYCTSCQKEFTGSSNLVAPVKCPYCKGITGASLRKYKCKLCGKVFPGYLQKFDPETKRLIERRKRGEQVDDSKIGSQLMTEFGDENWVDSGSQEAYDILNGITCPNPDCNATGTNVETIFPKAKK
jgi:hypothetical protein